MFFNNAYIACLTQLEGVNEPVVLQVFVGNDTGRVKPHGFYQACKVTGRNTTACKEVNIDGTTVIEVSLDPSTNMTLAYVVFLTLKLGCFYDKCYSNTEFQPQQVKPQPGSTFEEKATLSCAQINCLIK